jgi:hypothetical protein
MNTSSKHLRYGALFTAVLALMPPPSQGGEVGHFMPGVPSIRDYVVPEPGFYTAVMNYGYSADRVNDAGGDRQGNITINPGPGPGLTLKPEIDVEIYAISPTFIWVTDWKALGANYAAYVAPSFATASISGSLSTLRGRGVSGNHESDLGVGDLFVQPIWLGWNQKHYGFYAPTGRYDTENVTLPIVGTYKTEALDNIGLGFWTNQFQGAVSWYPWEDKRMAVSGVLTYETHGEKADFDFTPGDNLTFNWGISQFLPLTKSQKLLLEVGPMGYSSWQVTDDKGSDAKNTGAHDEVHAVGCQIGLTYVPWMLSINFRYLNEFAARDRFQGQSFGLNIAKKFW